MRRLGPGLIDAGASSAATFVAGIAASRMLGLPELGAYALIFGALMLAIQLPTQMVFSPAEARLVEQPSQERLGYLVAIVRGALPWGVSAGALTLVIGMFVAGGSQGGSRLDLAVTGAFAAALSPFQEHVRRMLHLAGRHRGAAMVSLARAGIVTGSILVGATFGLRAALLPLGSLALGDLLSMMPVLVFRGTRRDVLPFGVRDLRTTGSWLLLSSLAPPAAGFLASFAVASYAGDDALGLAEAARVTAQPVLVLAVGVAAVMAPQAMEAAHRGDRVHADALTRRLATLLALATLAYVALTLLPEGLNPVRWAVPAAFVVPGLTQLSILAAAANATVHLQRGELIVLNRSRSLAGAEVLSGVVRGTLGMTSAWVHAWAVPIGFLGGGVMRIISFTRSLRRSQSVDA